LSQKNKRAGGVAQVVERLPSKHETPNSNPRRFTKEREKRKDKRKKNKNLY
jgi:hypothetical protein